MSLLCLNCPEWLQDIAFMVVSDHFNRFIKMLHRHTKNQNKWRPTWDHTGWAISYMWTIAEINLWWWSSGTAYVGVTLKHWGNFFLFCTQVLSWIHFFSPLYSLFFFFKTDLESLDPRGRTPLHLAVTLGHLDCARILLQQGANVNKQNHNGWSGKWMHAWYRTLQWVCCYRSDI